MSHVKLDNHDVNDDDDDDINDDYDDYKNCVCFCNNFSEIYSWQTNKQTRALSLDCTLINWSFTRRLKVDFAVDFVCVTCAFRAEKKRYFANIFFLVCKIIR